LNRSGIERNASITLRPLDEKPLKRLAVAKGGHFLIEIVGRGNDEFLAQSKTGLTASVDV
jgi:hypothetical protein